jgi:rod shape-determining protein MreD
LKYIIYIATVIALLGINVGVFANLKLSSGVPNILLLYIVTLSLTKQSHDHLWVAFLAGILLDFYSGTFIGSFALSFPFLAAIVQALANKFLVLEINWKFLAGLAVGGWLFVYGFVAGYTFLAYKLGWSTTFVDIAIIKNKVIPELIYNLILLLPVYWVSVALRQFMSQVTRKTE